MADSGGNGLPEVAEAPGKSIAGNGFFRQVRRRIGDLQVLPQALRLVRDAGGPCLWLWTALILVQSAAPVALMFLFRNIVNLLSAAMDGSTEAAADTVVDSPWLAVGGLFLGVMLVVECARAASEWIRTIVAERVLNETKRRVHARALAARLADFDSPGYHDLLYRANYEGADSVMVMVESATNAVRGLLVLPSVLFVLYPLAPWLPIAALIAVVPVTAAVFRHARDYHRWWVRATGESRRADYLDWVVTGQEPALEIRQFGIGPGFARTFQQLRARLSSGKTAVERRNALRMAAALAASLTIGAVAMLVLVRQVAAGTLSLGDLVFCYQGFTNAQSVVRELVGHGGSLIRSGLYVRAFFAFVGSSPPPDAVLPVPRQCGHVSEPADDTAPVDGPRPGAIPPAAAAPPEHENGNGRSFAGASAAATSENPCHRVTKAPELEFRQVGFRYPGTDREVISDLSVRFPAGKITAVLGGNGAGKTSLIKLIMRCYEPHHGSITLAGTDLREINPEQLRQAISLMQQEPVHLQVTVREYILADSDHSRGHARLASAIADAGVAPVLASLPNGLDTLLGRAFLDGHEISGGQWRRLALARALCRDAPVILLDEPTSALDPWEEAQWARELASRLLGRTVVLVTHRPALARAADHIVLINNGRLAGQGTHPELLANCPLYQSLHPARESGTPASQSPTHS